ncbi:MAG TPA: YibE/F family protein [Candidatus Woesebacteria bacterium]|nr:YibE/F family protein [Candidatus Woesebacteria bacterium]
MKKIFLFIAILFVFLSPNSLYAQSPDDRIEAKIVKINNTTVTVELLESAQKGKIVPITLFDERQLQTQQFIEGDYVLVSTIPGPEGDQFILVDHVRTFPLLLLFALFLLVVIVIGKVKGILSFIGMIFSFVIIGQFIVPQIMLGNDPLFISLLGSLFIIPATFYIGHGFKWQTTIAVISTFIALLITGILAYIFVIFAKLTGFSAEEAIFIQAIPGQQINIQSLLLAGIVIGAMGVLDDITISQTSIVDKLIQANPKYTFKKVFSEAMDVGRDHISSLVNTLVLVYAGAALPLFVLFHNAQLGGYSEVINMEIIATEIVRTLVSSIGIISAVPITTLFASWYIKKHS